MRNHNVYKEKQFKEKNSLAKTKGFRLKGLWRVKDSVVALAMALFLGFSVAPGYCTEPEPTLALNFDMAEMFEWAQMILNMMMPVLYITLGVSLAFIIVRALKQAFN